MIDKKTFDYIWNLHEACELAETLGYYLNYLDGANCNEEWENEMRQKINSLVGEKWPQEVLDAHNRGLNTGSRDS